MTLPMVVDVLVASGVVSSKSEARRVISQGGAYVTNVRVSDLDARLTESDLLDDGTDYGLVIVRRGRSTVGAVRVPRAT